MKYYKFVTEVNGRLFSSQAYHWAHAHLYAVEYKVGSFVYPKFNGSKLFAFDSYEKAIEWLDDPDNLYECEVLNPEPAFRTSWTTHELGLFWEFYNNKKSMNGFNEAPAGTIFCDAVKLIKKVSE